jgi:S-adenosylhomocysteine hydrolase
MKDQHRMQQWHFDNEIQMPDGKMARGQKTNTNHSRTYTNEDGHTIFLLAEAVWVNLICDRSSFICDDNSLTIRTCQIDLWRNNYPSTFTGYPNTLKKICPLQLNNRVIKLTKLTGEQADYTAYLSKDLTTEHYRINCCLSGSLV